MKKETLANQEAVQASTEGMLACESFLHENYLFRRNVLNGKVEFLTLSADGKPSGDYRPLTTQALNSIILRAKREEVCEQGNPKGDIQEIVNSEEVPQYTPVQSFLDSLAIMYITLIKTPLSKISMGTDF